LWRQDETPTRTSPKIMTTYKIAAINGDGIGHEIVPAAMRLVNAIAVKHGFGINATSFPYGAGYYQQNGHPMPDDGLDILQSFDAILFHPGCYWNCLGLWLVVVFPGSTRRALEFVGRGARLHCGQPPKSSSR